MEHSGSNKQMKVILRDCKQNIIVQVGLASIAAAVQRAGGSLQHPGSELDDDLETIAAGIETVALPEVYVLGEAISHACSRALKDKKKLDTFLYVLEVPQKRVVHPPYGHD